MAGSLDTINKNLEVLGFTNTSVTSIDEIIAIAVAQVMDTVLAEIANSESIITNLLISQQGYGKSDYYTGKALEFQYGDDLVINTDINPVTGEPYLDLIYPVIDTTKQIIAQAAFQASAVGGSQILFLKVATAAISGGLGPLSDAQLTAFQSYMLNFEILDLPINIISLPANILEFNSVATYLSSFDLPTLQTNLANALTTFQNSFQLNGTFYDGGLEGYIQTNVPGMRNFFISQTTIDGVPFSDFTNLSSGYFNYANDIIDNIIYNAVTS